MKQRDQGMWLCRSTSWLENFSVVSLTTIYALFALLIHMYHTMKLHRQMPHRPSSQSLLSQFFYRWRTALIHAIRVLRHTWLLCLASLAMFISKAGGTPLSASSSFTAWRFRNTSAAWWWSVQLCAALRQIDTHSQHRQHPYSWLRWSVCIPHETSSETTDRQLETSWEIATTMWACDCSNSEMRNQLQKFCHFLLHD